MGLFVLAALGTAACRPATVQVEAIVWDPAGGCAYRGPVTLDADYWWAYSPEGGGTCNDIPVIFQADDGRCLYIGCQAATGSVEETYPNRRDPCFRRDPGDPPIGTRVCDIEAPLPTCTTERRPTLCPELVE